MDIEALNDRLAGNRYRRKDIDESFTVLGCTGPTPLLALQYDDGTFWDEMGVPESLEEGASADLGLDPEGVESDVYEPLQAGPNLHDACPVGEHDWWPSPDDLWDNADDFFQRETIYYKIVRCVRCGLSGDSAHSVGYGDPPTMCHSCSTVLAGDEGEYVFEMEREGTFCEDCA